jgi:glycosyltransferase involved in cell wall biosynthesis
MSYACTTDRTMQARGERLRIGIAIATAGRPEIVRRTIDIVEAQIRRADTILVCSPDAKDVTGLSHFHPDVTQVLSPRGLPHQRNRLIEAAGELDILVFLDDDFVMAPDYLLETEAAFLRSPDVVMTTGQVIADGITGSGLSFEEAEDRLSAMSPTPPATVTDVYNAYGCNMAVRLATVRDQDLRFDEELPLYAWLEDVDFSRRIAPFGRIVRVGSATGVHLGVKSGRQSGVRLGYSQIANPCYLIAKGTCSWKKGLYHIGRNFLANLYGVLRGEKAIDRMGRLSGNANAMVDLILQRSAPSRALLFR